MAIMRGRGRYAWAPLLVFSTFVVGGCRCEGDAKSKAPERTTEITVLRVESPSPERPGAEHCDEQGKDCSPLAPQQKLAPNGLVRTFAGGKVSLDFGGGRRIDLDPMSETILSADALKLEKGRFALESTPLAQKEPLPALQLIAGERNLTPVNGMETAATVSMQDGEALLTVRRGKLDGIAFPDITGDSPQVGQSVRIAGARIYRTAEDGQELPALPYLAPRSEEFAQFLAPSENTGERGLGTMTARLPNTDQVRDGVVLKTHHVRVVIRDGYARTEVEEEFENTTPHVLEGRYRFAVPGDASLSRLALWVGDTLVEGEVVERKRAADIYSKIVDRPVPRDPALLEWVTGGEMSLKVFPIVPEKSRRVVLAYNQALSTENGVLRYVYPLSLGQGRETTIEDLAITVHVSDSRATLRNVRVPAYDAEVGREGSWTTVSLSLSGTAPSQDFELLADRSVEPTAQISAYVPSWGKTESTLYRNEIVPEKLRGAAQGYFALRVSADMPESAQRPQPLPHDRALIVDVSQSQSLATIRAQAALAYGILREMNPDETFVLLACDSACEAYPPEGPTVVTPASVRGAAEFLAKLTEGGSSDIAGALVAATAQLSKLPSQRRTRQVVCMGDGRATSGDLSAQTIATRVASELAAARVDLRLIGAGRTLEEGTLLGLARALDATYDPLHSGTSLEERIFELAAELRRPVIRDVRLHLPQSLRTDEKLRLPALRLGQELRVTGEILDLSGGEVTLEGNLAGAAYRLSRPLQWARDASAQNPLVPRLWAMDRILSLQANEANRATRDEIIALSTAHRTMSAYTSFLVLENEQMYRDFGVTRSTRNESDQPESAFSDVDHPSPSSSPGSEMDAARVSSFEELEASSVDIGALDRLTSKDSPARSAVPKMRPPAPSPAPRPRAEKPSSAASGGGAEDFEGLGSHGSGQKSAGGAARERPPFISPPPWDDSGKKKLFVPPHRRRAHLSFARANDEWRKWGEQNLIQLAESLRADDRSRARHEAFILGHLKLGRFREARQAAIRLTELDPDYAPARRLLAYAAVVDGDHELARRMLDVASEAAPGDGSVHAESARSFEVAGDLVRACAHYRALAELAPQLDEATQRAQTCWNEVLGRAPPASTKADEGQPGQLQVDIVCDDGIAPQDCPSPVVVAPDGSVLSPWTPNVGLSSRTRVTFVKLRSGDYYVLVLGGSPRAKGAIVLTGRHENQEFRFDGGGMHTVAKVSVGFW